MIVHTCTLRIETKDTATAVFMDIAVSVGADCIRGEEAVRSADNSVLAQNGQQTPLITLSFIVQKSRFVALYIF